MPRSTMTWGEVVASFRITTAAGLLSMQTITRHQDARATLPWLKNNAQPLALLFLSHRWETPEHPDSNRRLMVAIHQFLEILLAAVEAMLVPQHERLALVPSLPTEGMLCGNPIPAEPGSVRQT